MNAHRIDLRTVISALALAAMASGFLRADEAKPGIAPVGPKSPREELATFRIAPGFRVELVASEPDVVDPVALAFDERGRLYVAEMRGYPNAGVGQGNMSTGKIKRLEDRDGDGVYETSMTFADGLRFPTSVMPWKDGLLVAVAPDILYLEDTDGDGQADRRRTLYTGFNLDNIQQLVNGLQWGLDNWVYASAGNKGGTITSVEKPNLPAVELHGRGIRFHPETPGSLEPTSGGGQFGLAADDGQHWFTATNSQHLRQIVLPDHYLRRNPYLAVSAVTLDIPDHGAACPVHRISPFEGWRVERTQRRKGSAEAARFPSTELVPGGYITSACSPLVYTADRFPSAYRGDSFVCDPANNLIHRDKLVPQGVVFSAKRADGEHEFLASSDNWFRPVFLALGPDGAIYVADFYREVIETPLSLPEDMKARLNLESRGRGRIWRIVPEGARPKRPPALHRESPVPWVQHLNEPNSWWRLTAQRLLVQQQNRSVVPALERLAAAAKSPQTRTHALWTLHGLKDLKDRHIVAALADGDAGVREQALRLAEERFVAAPNVLKAALQTTRDPSVFVRFQLALSLGAAEASAAAVSLAELLKRDGADPWMQTALLSSSARSAGTLLERLGRDPEFTKNASDGRLRVLNRLAAVAGARHNEADLARALRLVADTKVGAENTRRAILQGLGQGLKNSQSSLASFWNQPPPGLKEVVAGVRKHFEEAATAAQDEKRPLNGRLEAVQLLASGPFETVSKALASLLAPQQPMELQLAAVRALSAHEEPAVAEILLSAWDGYSPAVRREVIEALFAQAGRLRLLLNALETKRVVAGQLDPFRLEQLRKHRDARIRKRAEAILAGQATASRKAVVQEYQAVLNVKGDAPHGRELFRKICATCHRLENVGTEVGPDLLSALRNKSREALLIDILDPSREVDPRYLNYTVTTTAGRVFTGLIAVEAPSSVTVRRAERAEDTVLRSQIEEIRATPKSLMPEELEKQLSKQDVADVIAYLQDVAEPKRGAATDPPFYPDKARLLIYRDSYGKEHPIRNADDWQRRRQHILANMQLVMGPLPDDSRKVPLDVQVTEEVKTAKYIRRKLTFAVEKGDRLPAYLFVPTGQAGRVPAVLCLHPTNRQLGKGVVAGLGGKDDRHYAVQLAERGYVTLAPDYVKSGDYQFDPYTHGYVSATMKGIWNHMRCVDLLQSLPEVNHERIGVIGHSLGGHNSMFVAAFDPRITCVVSNCGFCSFPTYYQGNLAGWSHDGYMPRIRSAYDLKPERMPFDFPEVVAALAPRAFLASAPVRDSNFDVQGVKDCIAAARPVYELLGVPDKLAANYPDSAHDFPDDARAVAYEWLDRWLKK